MVRGVQLCAAVRRGRDATVRRDVAPVMKLASSLARKAIRDALSSGSQTFLGDGGCDFGGAVQGLFIFALLEHCFFLAARYRAKILPASYIKANAKIRSVSGQARRDRYLRERSRSRTTSFARLSDLSPR